MARMMGIDFGEKRVGIALSDSEGRYAIPFRTLIRSSDQQVIQQVSAWLREEQVTKVALGEPLSQDGSTNTAAERVRSFGNKLARASGLEVVYVAETLTSVAARERLQEAGVDLRRHPERIDAVAAQIILEEAIASALPQDPGREAR